MSGFGPIPEEPSSSKVCLGKSQELVDGYWFSTRFAELGKRSIDQCTLRMVLDGATRLRKLKVEDVRACGADTAGRT